MLRNKIQGIEATDPDFPTLSLSERRKKLRVRTFLRLGLRVQGQESMAVVIDLSLSGLKLRSSLDLEVGDLVELFVKHEDQVDPVGSVRCRVVWAGERRQCSRSQLEAGLSFADTRENMQHSWVKYLLEQLGFDDQKTFQKRKFLRASGVLPARIFQELDGEALGGQIINLGVGGALMSSSHALKPNTMIHCETCLWRILPALRLPCRVMAVVTEDNEEELPPTYLHSLLFLGMDTEQVKLLGNYVIHLLNQCQPADD